MGNKTEIKGDGNNVFQAIEKSKIEFKDNENLIVPEKSRYSLYGIVIAALALISAVIIGWDKMIIFFTK